MENYDENLLREMEQTRTSLTEKLEALESQIAGRVQAGAEVVEHATEAAAEIVENVKATVHEVTHKVGESVQSVVSIFDVGLQTRRHPWVVVGLATATGCVLGSMLGRRPREPERTARAAPVAKARHHHKGNGSDGASHDAGTLFGRRATDREETGFWKKEWFKEQMERVKGLALGTLLGVVRDMARAAVPGPVGDRIAEEVDAFTTHLGAEPIAGPVLVGKDEPEEGDATRTEKGVNRVFSGKAGREGTPWSDDQLGGEG